MKKIASSIVIILTMVVFIWPSSVFANGRGPHHKPQKVYKKHKPVQLLNYNEKRHYKHNPAHLPSYQARNYPKAPFRYYHHPRSYQRNHLPSVAAFAMTAAVSYAIIDNRYYRQQGDTYIYLEQPPAYR
ncbi:hypothetical protein [Desulfosediminicola ganghwensis]|uniref:hypothetical protein n=1 Tax=Desulfosediminicola ganghwensis TaxID=2569540 RepID=UPI0010AC61CC|nr:hypothetical protein [Desulfosediminicola ganghwensis]